MNRVAWALLIFLYLNAVLPSTIVRAAPRKIVATPTPAPALISFSVICADDGTRTLHRFFPRVHIVVDSAANALVVSATPDELGAIRQIASGIDTKSPLEPVTQSISLHRIDATELARRLSLLYPDAKFSAIERRSRW